MSSTCKPFLTILADGRKINGKKSKVVCINGAKKKRIWNLCGCEIGEVKEYKYLGSEDRFEWWF